MAIGGGSRAMWKELALRMLAGVENLTHRGQSPVVFVPRLNLGVGGPRTFMALLVEGLRKRGMRVTSNRMVRADAAIIPISAPPGMIREWKSRGTLIVQRLDGLFYDASNGVYNAHRNHDAAVLYKELADVVVFQSRYSQSQCSWFMGEPGTVWQTVILNGTDPARFSPGDRQCPSVNTGGWKMVSTGNFRDASMVVPVVQALDQLWLERQDFRWTMIGPVSFSGHAAWMSRPYLAHMADASRAEIAAALKGSDLFVYAFLNPNCPNSVIEAGAAALPVVGFGSGAMQELCGYNSELLASMPDRVIHVESDLDPQKLLACIRLCLAEYTVFRARAMAQREAFGIDRAVDAYAETIQNRLLSRPLLS
ncbi:MAG: glycosyltransferase family 4 protein [Opitutales bacterium]|nr:glycosyltransferase family 4 protein [Opitutales bacterium]